MSMYISPVDQEVLIEIGNVLPYAPLYRLHESWRTKLKTVSPVSCYNYVIRHQVIISHSRPIWWV